MAKELQAYVVALKEANLNLRRRRNGWRLALAGSSVGVPGTGRFLLHQIFFSAQAKRLFGYEDDEIENTIEGWRAKAHPEDRDFIETVMEILSKGKATLIRLNIVFCVRMAVIAGFWQGGEG